VHFFPSGYNNVYYSTPRSMARFGLLMLNRGRWDATPILTDTTYFREMTNTSNTINKSYGYLWWLNGKESFMLPQSQIVFPGMLSPEAPHSMISALGKNAQILNIVPELNLVTVRMGDAPGSAIEVPTLYNNDIWKILKQVIRYTPTSVKEPTISRLNPREWLFIQILQQTA
jgi:CubicO group peptidase (beta-lactamase class C family)